MLESREYRAFQFRHAYFIVAIVMVTTLGCGSSVDLSEVVGKVVYPDGASVPGGTIEFMSIDTQPATIARSGIHSDGTFRLETTLASGTASGAPVGKYRAVVRSPMRSERDPGSWRPTVKLEFGSYETSGLQFTIEPGKNDLKVVVQQP